MADTCETVKIMPSHESQGEFVEINAEDFDAAVHTPFVEPEAEAEAPARARRGEKPAE